MKEILTLEYAKETVAVATERKEGMAALIYGVRDSEGLGGLFRLRMWGEDGAPTGERFSVVSKGGGGYVCYHMDGEGNKELVWTMDENNEYELTEKGVEIIGL